MSYQQPCLRCSIDQEEQDELTAYDEPHSAMRPMSNRQPSNRAPSAAASRKAASKKGSFRPSSRAGASKNPTAPLAKKKAKVLDPDNPLEGSCRGLYDSSEREALRQQPPVTP
mmetsp:Transcript_15758/g.24256  ORF Transcript_15758/g.24256 Transcript_15758/m.24256 type:complete len:113 (+) Transcript_15758:830-1168(+)